VFRRRHRHMQAMSTQPKMRRARSTRSETIVMDDQDPPTQIESVIFWLKNASLGDITKELNAIKEHLGTERIANLMTQFNEGVGSILKNDSGFNEETVNQLLQALLTAFEAKDLPEEEKNEPVSEPVHVEVNEEKENNY